MGDNPYTCYKGTIPWGIILRGGSLRKQKKKYYFVERTTASRFTFLQMVGSQVASGGLNGRFKKRNITRCSFFLLFRDYCIYNVVGHPHLMIWLMAKLARLSTADLLTFKRKLYRLQSTTTLFFLNFFFSIL